MKLVNLLTNLKTKATRNEAELFAGSAIAGVIVTGVLSYRAGLKASDIIEKHKNDIKLARTDEARRSVQINTAKELAITIAPSVIVGGLTIASIVSSSKEFKKRILLLSTCYEVASSNLKDWKLKTEELVGEKKTQEIGEKIVKDKLNKFDSEIDQNEYNNAPIPTNHGTVLCKDMMSGREFYSCADYIQRCITELSIECASDMYVSLNEFYDRLGIERIPLGDDLGWNVDDLIKGVLPIMWTATLNNRDIPVLAVDYEIAPRKDYEHFM